MTFKTLSHAATTGPRSQRVRVRRGHKLAIYDRDTLNAILDAAHFCHVGYVVGNQPIVTPTLCWRAGDHVYWHGSSASRMIRNARSGMDVCLTVTLMDGWVLARSAFHHTVNYRSAVLLGRAFVVTNTAAKVEHLRNFMEQMFPGRWDKLRPPNQKELRATTLVGMVIDEASAKVRSGPPKDEDEDYDWPVWAGELPLEQREGAPRADPRNLPGIELFRRAGR